ncbi:glycophorin-C isoform X2 [Vulpes vulpes]|uniref:Glycophorin-C isoform X2 n=1 Tax=Vulpes vulpes TaxID=9627 RepID=A0ABM5AFQ4_VULVU
MSGLNGTSPPRFETRVSVRTLDSSHIWSSSIHICSPGKRQDELGALNALAVFPCEDFLIGRENVYRVRQKNSTLAHFSCHWGQTLPSLQV